MKITWFASGIDTSLDGSLSSKRASTRLRCLVPARMLESLGHEVNIIQSDRVDALSDVTDEDFGDAIIFMKSFVPIDEALAVRARELGRRVIYDFCDFDFREPALMAHRREMAMRAHRCVASSNTLAAVVAGTLEMDSPAVVPDPYEGPAGEPKFSPGNELLKLVWFGHVANLQNLFDLLDLLADFGREVPLSLTVITEAVEGMEEAFAQTNMKFEGRLILRLTPWSPEAVWQGLIDCDLVIIPSADNDQKRAKSSNRVVESLRAGRFVVANPVPAYQDFGDFARLDTDVIAGLRWTMAHRQEIKSRVESGQVFVTQRYSPEMITSAWMEVLTATP